MLKSLLLVLLLLGLAAQADPGERVKVASKAFPESWVLSEALCLLAGQSGAEVESMKSLGATEVIYQALRQGSIDVYPEYAGTIKEVLLKNLKNPSDAEVLAALARDGIGMSYPLGYSNDYAMAVPLSSPLRTLSDLAAHPELRIAMDGEFRERDDGWRLLVKAYGMHPQTIIEMQHELGYAALVAGKVEVLNVYSTDGQLAKLGLRLLVDDQKAFPRYDAVLLYRVDLPVRAPGAWAEMCGLIGAISTEQMSRANAVQMLDQRSDKEAARSLLTEALPHWDGRNVESAEKPRLSWDWAALGRNVRVHLQLMAVSLCLAILVGIPLGVLASKSRLLATLTLSATGLMQTIPSLALLAFLVPVLGVGAKPALVALFLYSLLPIVRNTYTGLKAVPGNLSEAAVAIGLTARSQLWRVRLPMASPLILGGIKTSAVINVGTATLAALVGAGGLGVPILQGIQLLDRSLILQGALPAAGLALLVQAAFDGLERWVVPRGLRL